jgi:hypothetical protein
LASSLPQCVFFFQKLRLFIKGKRIMTSQRKIVGFTYGVQNRGLPIGAPKNGRLTEFAVSGLKGTVLKGTTWCSC